MVPLGNPFVVRVEAAETEEEGLLSDALLLDPEGLEKGSMTRSKTVRISRTLQQEPRRRQRLLV